MSLLCPQCGPVKCGLEFHQDTHSGLWHWLASGPQKASGKQTADVCRAPFQIPKRSQPILLFPNPILSLPNPSSHRLFSLQSFSFEIYSVLEAFKFYLAEARGPRRDPGCSSGDFCQEIPLSCISEATPCCLQSLCPRGAALGLLNCRYSQELSHTFSLTMA